LPERILIVGLGNIGRRHLTVVKEVLPDAGLVILRRPGGDLNGLSGVTLVHDIDAAGAAGIEAAIVANPAPMHVETALALARFGIHPLIEKPLSDGLDGIEELLRTCRRRRLVLQVGYCLRFHPSVRAMKEALDGGRIGRVLGVQAEVGSYLPDWRSGADYRQGVSARSGLGGGVLLELSHEIDLVRWLAGEISSVTALCGRRGDLEIDVEDSADLLLTFESGAVGNIHMDMLQRTAARTCKVIGTDGTLVWDGIKFTARLYRAETESWAVLYDGENDGRDLMYSEQFKHFLACVGSGDTPLVTGEDGRRAVEIVLAAKRSAREGRGVAP
jgi:predicted dehydrogenase